MGMTIDESIDYLSNENTRLKLSASDNDAIDRIISAYLITKANYNEQLKTNMMAMLKELQLEIKEEKRATEHLHYDDLENAESYNNGIDNCIDTIQTRIDKLKENTDGSNN